MQVQNTRNFDCPWFVSHFLSVILKNSVWVHYKAYCHWLYKCCFDTNASWCFSLPITVLFSWERFKISTFLLNWIHSKMISAAAFRIIGLANVQMLWTLCALVRYSWQDFCTVGELLHARLILSPYVAPIMQKHIVTDGSGVHSMHSLWLNVGCLKQFSATVRLSDTVHIAFVSVVWLSTSVD